MNRLKVDTAYMVRFAHYKEEPDFELALTAAIAIKSMFVSSTITYYTINKLQTLLNVSNKRAKQIDKALIACHFAEKRKRAKGTDLIIAPLYQKNYSYVYIYVEKTENGVFLYNKAPGVNYNFANKERQTFEEKMRVVRCLAACYKLHYYNISKLADTSRACDEPKTKSIRVEDLLKTTDLYLYQARGWAKFFLQRGNMTLDSIWTLNVEFKNDKVKAKGQENTVPIAMSYITSHIFGNTFSLNTVRRTIDEAINSGCIRKYNNDRILIYYNDSTSDDKYINPYTSFKYDRYGRPTKKYFRINWREIKINGDLKKKSICENYVTEAYKQPGENSYAILALGITEGLEKQTRRDTFRKAGSC